MTHLTIDQLLATLEPGLEPGVASFRAHLTECPECQTELTLLEQRTARLKALATLRPSRDHFGEIRLAAARERRVRRVRRFVVAGTALAASVAIAVVAAKRPNPLDRKLVAADPELAEMMSRSRELEQAIQGFDQDRAVVDGRAVGMATSLEDRLAAVDRQIEVVDLMDPSVRQARIVKLWRERVGLLDALVDVHLTGARYVGF